MTYIKCRHRCGWHPSEEQTYKENYKTWLKPRNDLIQSFSFQMWKQDEKSYNHYPLTAKWRRDESLTEISIIKINEWKLNRAFIPQEKIF